MNNDNRVYFVGAGASKQDRFPLTDELKHGIAWAILEEPERFEPLASELEYLYNVRPEALKESAGIWKDLRRRVSDRPRTDRNQIPNVTDLISNLDWMIREQSSFGPGVHSGERTATGALAATRDLVVQALCYCLGTYQGLDACSTTRGFLQLVRPDDTLITTNWDLLLDIARHTRFGSVPEDYGTTGNVRMERVPIPPDHQRPRLLKLHGSLSWRYCQRCQRLMIDPMNHVAGERVEKAICECTCRFSELIVTPGFVREYRNIHLLNIWREAMLGLAFADEWFFIGYSLPADDVGVGTLLLKARCVRHDLGKKDPVVTIVTGQTHREETLAHYQGILPQAELADGDFGDFVQRGGTASL